MMQWATIKFQLDNGISEYFSKYFLRMSRNAVTSQAILYPTVIQLLQIASLGAAMQHWGQIMHFAPVRQFDDISGGINGSGQRVCPYGIDLLLLLYWSRGSREANFTPQIIKILRRLWRLQRAGKNYFPEWLNCSKFRSERVLKLQVFLGTQELPFPGHLAF